MEEGLIIAAPARNESMKIRNIELTNYRNHKTLEIEFDEGTNLIVGPNGSGKTNILEAIHFLATTKPYKAKYDREVINHEETFAKIEAQNDNDRLEIIVISNPKFENTSSKKAKVNRVTKSMRNFSPYLYTVLFTPEEIEVLRDSPSRRRHYLDMVLFQIDNEYKRAIIEYTKAVRQRNKVLEIINERNTGADQLGFWDTKIIDSGNIIQDKREELLNFLKTQVYARGKKINGGTELILKYKKSEIDENRLAVYREREIAAKATLVGPHRDDFELMSDGFDLASFGSRGQQRTAVLALKLSEIDFISERTGQRPILLLDDIFSELDRSHSKVVISEIDKQQSIITSTEEIKNLEANKVIELG